jgi:Putative beta barrel porin-7 (BBP7)
MCRGSLLAIASLLIVAGILPAQERVPLPPPDPGPASVSPPPNTPNVQPPAPLLVPPQPDNSAPGPNPPPPPPQPYAPYPPPPPPYGLAPYGPPPYGPYGPPLNPPPYVLRDPVDPDVWIGFEGLLWWSKNQPLSVPVVTTGPASQGSSAGNLGMPGTTSLNRPLNYGADAGFRVFAGGWFDVAHTFGLEGSFFFLGRQSASFGVNDRAGNGSFVINEPLSGAPPFSTQVSAPGVETGNVLVNSSSRLGGGDLNLQYNLYRANGWTINLLGGYRYLELDESLTIAADSTLFTTTTYTDNMNNVLATAPPGSVVTAIDSFKTRNQFNGGQVGSAFQYVWGRWLFGGMAKVAIGDMHEVITIDGNTNVNPAGGTPVPLSGGNYATLQTGRYSTDHFAVVPEGRLTVGYALTPQINGLIGYNFLYLSSVARPGNQIDNSFDGVSHPGVPMTISSYWSQGLTASLLFKF